MHRQYLQKVVLVIGSLRNDPGFLIPNHHVLHVRLQEHLEVGGEWDAFAGLNR